MAADWFVGRSRELAQLEALVDGLTSGIGGVVLVEGEQGIGKSALLRAGLAGAAGSTVLWAAADEMEQQFPLRLIADCLADADPAWRSTGAGGAGSGLAGAGGIFAGDPVLGAVEDALAAVDRLCAVAPVVLVAEDLQWADEASLLVWHRLSRAVGQLPLLLAASCRPAPEREDLTRLLRALGGRSGSVMELRPLPDAELRELVGRVVGGSPGQRLTGILDQTGANPLYARELADGLVREGQVTIAGGIAEVPAASAPIQVPASLAAAIARRLSWLPEDVIGILRWAAILGQEFSVSDLNAVTGRSAGELIGVIDTAQAAGVLAEAGLRLGFRHGLIRQVLYEGTPAALRVALHLEAAHVLASAGAPPERVAAQLAAAPGPAEGWVPDWLREAAPLLIYRAPQVAAELLRRVLEQLAGSDPRRDELEAGLVAVEFLLVRDDEVQRAGRRLLARAANSSRAAEMAWLVAYSLMRTGRAAEASAQVRQALARPEISDAQAARLRAIWALNLTELGQVGEADGIARAALDLAEQAGDNLAAGYALHALSSVSACSRDSVAMLAYIDRGLTAIADDPQASDLRLLLLSNRIGALTDLDRQAEAVLTARQALVQAERAGTPRLTLIRLELGQCYFENGQWDDAIAEVESAAALPGPANRLLLHALLALIAAYRDDMETADEHLRAVSDEEIGRPVNGPFADLMILARAVAAERRGEVGAAAAILGRCLEPGLAEQLPSRYLLMPMLTRLALARDAASVAAAAARVAEQEATHEPLRRKVATAAHCRGLLAGDPAPVLEAAAYWAMAERPLEQAVALEDAAELAAAAGNPAAARKALAASRELYDGLGATWGVQRATARLRGYGVRRGRGSYRHRPVSGWAALTPTELMVAKLVATGISNPDIAGRLFLSRNTVQTHVSHILAKLGAPSRAEIIRQSAERVSEPASSGRDG